MSTLFDLAFSVAMPFWALMILLPTWSWTAKIMSSPWVVLPTLVVWAVAATPLFGPLWTLVLSPSLPELTALLAEPGAVTLLWAQIIAWDLFIGRWIYLDSRTRGIHPLIISPLLVLTVLLSPIGLPLYLILRTISRPAPVSPATASPLGGHGGTSRLAERGGRPIQSTGQGRDQGSHGRGESRR